jgi:hypothetical protein
MRILFISTFYPPHIVGGWEQLVQEINERLQDRGHITHVLTSQHGVGHPLQEPGVDRFRGSFLWRPASNQYWLP